MYVCVSGSKKCKIFGKFCVRTKWMITILAQYGDLIAYVRKFQYSVKLPENMEHKKIRTICSVSVMIVIYGEDMKVVLKKP